MEFGLEKCAMLIGVTTHNGRNRTTKAKKDQNVRSKRNLQILGNIESGQHQTRGDEEKK